MTIEGRRWRAEFYLKQNKSKSKNNPEIGWILFLHKGKQNPVLDSLGGAKLNTFLRLQQFKMDLEAGETGHRELDLKHYCLRLLKSHKQTKRNLRLYSAKEMLAQHESQSGENHDGGAHSPPPAAATLQPERQQGLHEHNKCLFLVSAELARSAIRED